MSKKKSIIILAIASFLIVVWGLATFWSFKVPTYTLFGRTYVNDYNSIMGSIELGRDLKGGAYVVMEASPDDDMSEETVAKNINETIKLLRNRLSAKGYSDAVVVKQNENQIRVEIPNIQYPDEAFETICQRAVLEFRGKDADGVEDQVLLTGAEHVERAYVTYDASGNPAIAIVFNTEGTELFSEATANNINGNISIYLDETVVSSPSVSSQITDGTVVISGMSQEQSENIVIQITSGAFPMAFEHGDSRTIDPDLGEGALNSAIIAGAVGLLLIMVFFAVMYRGLGLAANLALIVYLLLFVLALAILPFVQLTLAGIAGVILSMVLAVDANIIIFERIKEEFYRGKTFKAAVKTGFSRARTAILDGNVVALIIAVMLLICTAGSIKALGMTLMIGIVLSVFTSLLVTRGIVQLFQPLVKKKDKFYHLKRGGDINA